MHIARKFLLPKQLQANGLASEQLTLTDPALLHVATQYTREAGVRSLERAIGAVVRFKAVEWAEHLDSDSGVGREYKDVVEEDELEAARAAACSLPTVGKTRPAASELPCCLSIRLRC